MAGAALVGTALVVVPLPARAADPCAAPTNPVVCENSKPGTDPSIWQISGSGDPTIQGFATDASVNVGGSISFKVKTSAAYTMTVYRLGWYAGLGAREIATLTPTPQTQPACLEDVTTSLYDCGNWAVSATWDVPSDAVSGVYIVRLRRSDTGGDSHIPFVVRDESSHSDLVLQTSDTTWQAYNWYGGSDFYTGGGSVGRSFKVSYNRPYSTRDVVAGRDFLFSNEYPMIRFLESNGYDVSYMSGVDTDRLGSMILNHGTFVSVGHDEYWSGAMRANVEAARDAGVNLAFFSGNEIYWRTRWENSIDGSGTPYRNLVSYKETWDNAKIDPSSEWTGTWRDPRFTPPATGGGNPENALTGTAYMSNDSDLPIDVPAQQGRNRFWRDTSVATAAAGGSASSVAPHSVGYESDEDLDNGFRPAGLIRLSTSTGVTGQYLYDFGNDVRPGTTTHNMTMYRAPSGALVFSAGTIQYAWALDSDHDGEATSPDPAVRQATVNLFADMGAQPLTPVSGLTAATQSTDTTGPSVVIDTPAAGAVTNGTGLTVSGTATDAAGEVAGVEVSLDDGVTWHPASGTTAWTYTGPIAGNGAVDIKVRAIDDSANIGPVATRAMTVSCPCSVFGEFTPATPAVADGSGVELGLRFQADSDGFVTGVRFYKGTGNTGTHTGSLWSASGTRLATGTFTGETSTGWQTLTFASPVSITAGTAYVVSYTAPSGHYAADAWNLSYRDTPVGPVRAMRSTSTSANGLYGNPGTFPTDSFQDTNYYVDVEFTPAGSSPPVPVTTVPTDGATSAVASAPIVATFNVAIQPGTATVTVQTGATTVPGTTSLDGTGKILTFTPDTALDSETLYTVTVAGAVSATGVAMAGPYGWSFTTGAPCPCSVFGTQAPDTADAGDSSAIELGMSFVPSISGAVTGVRFYKAAANTGTHTGSLWSSDGTLLATGTFSGESAEGWQTMTFPTPVAVTAGTTYVVSYYAPNGHYAATSGYFASAVTSGPITVPAAVNGRYRYGTGGGFPTSTWNASNYWVDLVFSDDGTVSADTTPPTISAVAVAPGQTSATVTWTTDEASTSTVSYGTSSASLDGTATSSGSATSHSVTVTGLTGETTYYFRVSSADAAGNSATSPDPGSSPGSFTTTAAPTCPCSVFSTGDVPVTVDGGDTSGIELGLRFTPSTDGVVTGVRFYKATANTGTHTGSLWSSDGTLLATGTFSGESAEGWQSLTFASPVAVTAGTTYVVSYFAPNGHYSVDSGYFTADVVSGPLTAPAAGNGVYLYGGGFPSTSFNASNYWVDVVFSDGTAPADTTPPTISGVAVAPGQTSATVTWTTDEASTSTVSYGTSSTSLDGTATSSGLTTSHSVTLSGLTPGTTYYLRATSADLAGNEATSPPTADAPTSFVTSSTACPCSVFTTAATPGTVDAGDGSAIEVGLRFTPSTDGVVTGVRFYKAAANTGTHTGSLWASDGTLLATGTFAGESADGWQAMTFPTPVTVTAGTTYLVSYYAPNGHYSVDGGYFTADVVSGPLTAPAATNGVYRYGAGGGFPTSTWNASNYWVDAVFVDSGSVPAYGPTISDVAASVTRTTATVTWTTSVASTSVVSYGTAADALTSSASTPGDVTSHSVTLAGLTPGVTYHFRVTSAVDGAFTTSPATGSAPSTLTTTSCPCSVFADTDVPAIVDSGESAALELGMRFVPDVDGTVTGVRFYKSAANTGTHTGSLWAADGTQLATGTFSGESADGWQTLTFAAPVAVTAGTAYVVSYYTPTGHYSYDAGYFAAEVSNPPLSAPATSNGVYRYGTGGGFPSSSWNASNYWVDVVLTS